ncbi:hypothetical protein PEC301899_07690 [Pectobacterium carotovorum subsp. carotovorum]|nr:hypothetical protein PEC301899_07690 [Pectobacterium carotovorum subsp. carotovorum]
MLLFQVGAQWHDKQKDAIFQESKLEMIKRIRARNRVRARIRKFQW